MNYILRVLINRSSMNSQLLWRWMPRYKALLRCTIMGPRCVVMRPANLNIGYMTWLKVFTQKDIYIYICTKWYPKVYTHTHTHTHTQIFQKCTHAHKSTQKSGHPKEYTNRRGTVISSTTTRVLAFNENDSGFCVRFCFSCTLWGVSLCILL